MKIAAGLSALLALGGAGIGGAAAQAAQDAVIDSFAEALAAKDFLLSRTVSHIMPDGRAIGMTRTYRLQVSATEWGWLIEGETVDVEVDAPPHLAQLAEIERRREDSGTFPMFLTRDGLLAPYEAPRPMDREAAAAATDVVVSRIENSSAEESRKQAAMAMARALAAAGQQNRIAWPVDLFRPSAAERVETREVSGGTVTVTLIADPDPHWGLMRRFERNVTTRIAGREREVRERWELQPATPRDHPAD